MKRASNLLGKLVDEKSRWKQQLQEINDEVKNLPFFSLISAAYSNYLSDKDEIEREESLSKWCKMCRNAKFNFIAFNFSESITLKWKSEGHPSDILSIQNSSIYLKATSTPFIIDPSSRITQWIKTSNKEEKNFEAISAADPKFSTHFELAIRFGKTLLIEDMTELGGMYYPMIRKELSRIGARKVYYIGDKIVDFNDGFKLILSSRDVTIKINPKVKAMIC